MKHITANRHALGVSINLIFGEDEIPGRIEFLQREISTIEKNIDNQNVYAENMKKELSALLDLK